MRAIEVDPQPDDFGGPAPISAATSLSIVPGCHLQRGSYQNAQCHQNAPPASGCSAGHSASQPVRQASQLDRTPNPTTNDIAWQRRRKPRNLSRNTSSPVSSHNVDLVASIGVGPLRRTTSEYDGNSRQPLRMMSGHVDSVGSPSSLSSPSRPSGRSPAHEHVEFPSSSWQGENWQNNELGTAALPGSPRASSTAAQHGKDGGPIGTSAVISQIARDSPRSSRSGHLTHRLSGESQGEHISRTATRPHRQPLDPFPASNARTTDGEDQKSQNRVFSFLSGLIRGQSQGDNNDRWRASLQSVDTFLDPSDNMQRIQSSHTQLRTGAESHYSLGALNLSRPSSACSHISIASSIESTLSFEVELTESEEPENVASPTPPTTGFFASSSLAEDIVYRPSALGQDDLNEGDKEDHVPPERASSSQSENRGSARDALSPVEHMRSQFDHPNTGDDTILPLPQPLSPQPAGSTYPTPTHVRTQNIRRSPADPSASSPREVWPTSPSSHYSFEFELTPTASGLGLLTGVASPRRQPLPQSPAVQSFPASPVNRSVRSTDAQSPIRNTESLRNSPQQPHASSPHLSAATPEDTQSVRTRPIGSLSYHNVPLPPSPALSASNSSARLQVRPGHWRSPRVSLYPSLASEDPELLSPSGLDVVFGLPTPGLSPMQTPALIRSPSMDPRSPVPSQMRIPGDIMGLLGAFLHSGHDLAHATFIFLSELSFLVVLRLLRVIRE